MPETTPLIKAALNLRVGAGFDVYLNTQMVSEEIKKTRIDIVHGYAYYYDFASDNKLQYIIIQFDRLIKVMSLMWVGFSNEEIMEFLRL